MLNKNDRVNYKGKTGTVMENQYRVYEGSNNLAYCDVLFDGEEYYVSVDVNSLQRL